MNKPWWKHFLSWWVLLGGAVIAALMLGLVWAGIVYFKTPVNTQPAPSPVVTVLAAPTQTPIPVIPSPAPTVTPTLAPSSAPPANESINLGSYVQISGTNGEGLRLRTAPGRESTPRFLGMEAEVFHVEDGPQYMDGFTWWYLVAPYDKNRSGWAVSNYLVIIQQP